MGQVQEITDDTFEAEVLQSELPVLIDFWGPNCAPCVAIAPHLETLATEHAGQLRVVKMNVHENFKMASQFKVQAVPTLIVLKGGTEVGRQKGAQGGLQALRRLVGSHL